MTHAHKQAVDARIRLLPQNGSALSTHLAGTPFWAKQHAAGSCYFVNFVFFVDRVLI